MVVRQSVSVSAAAAVVVVVVAVVVIVTRLSGVQFREKLRE